MEVTSPSSSVLKRTSNWKDQLIHLESRAAIKGDLDRPQEWAKRDLIQFSKNKCRDCLTVLQVGHQGTGKLFCRKGPGPAWPWKLK